MNVPEPVADAALTFARECVAESHNMNDAPYDFLGERITSWFDKHSSRRVVISAMKWIAMEHPLRMIDTVDLARSGWDLADEALRELIIEHIDRGEPLPTYLAAHNMDLVRGARPKPRGQKKADRYLRDVAVSALVLLVSERFNLPPTGRSTRWPSACRIVADALRDAHVLLSHKAVEAIWLRFGPIISPIGPTICPCERSS
jgi:hypothetical protein